MTDVTSLPSELLTESIFVNLLISYQQMVRRFEQDSGTSYTRVRVLSVFRGEPLNRNRIASQLGLDRTMIHRLVSSLIDEKLVREDRSAGSPGYGLTLTASGQKLRDRAIKSRKEIDRLFLKRLGESRSKKLIQDLEQMRECLIDKGGHDGP